MTGDNKSKDIRLESYSPDGEIELLNHISAEKNGWERRMKIIDSLQMHRSLEPLIASAKSEPFPSLAVLRPSKILDFVIEKTERDWTEEQKAYFNQPDFFDEITPLSLKKLPYKYSYRFLTEDGLERTIMIEDWEVGTLYWNCLKACDGNESEANRKVREKYIEIAANPNIFFFMGTSLAHHFMKSPFIIIGVTAPTRINIDIKQGELF